MDHNEDYSDLHLIEEFIDDGVDDDHSSDDDGNDARRSGLRSPPPTILQEPETYVSPGGTKYWIPYVTDDVKLSVGDRFASTEEADLAYRKYADEAGFDVRQSNRKENKNGVVQNRYLLCSRQGFSEKKDHDSMGAFAKKHKIRKTSFKRTGCKACIKFRFAKEDSSYVVYKLEERHNHKLYNESEKRFSRGRRQLKYTDYRNIYNATGASIGAANAHKIQSVLRGGVENVSASVVDYKNAARDMIDFVGNKDAQMLINLMNRRKQYAPDFTFEYLVVKGEMQAFFWVDEISKLNFKEFGDTVSFDATYRTNRHAYNFVPFICIDNHKRSVVVGSALISKEDGDKFSWVLQAFIKAHGKQPRFVITDQCLGMKEAISKVFTEATHRLCAWHIMKKFPGKVLISKEAYLAFKKRINKLVWSTHIDANYFEDEWQRTLIDFDLEGHEWLSDIYEIRHSWISAYYKDDPMSSLMRTTSRSESSHAYFRLYASFKNDLVRFLRAYDGCIEKQRNKHACLEFATRHTFPKCFSPLDIEGHASEVYTRLVFFDVQKEIRKAIYYCGLSFHGQEGDVKRYSVSHLKKNFSTKMTYEVLHDVALRTHTCQCNMFVRVGLLCRHIFKVLMNDGVDKIPDHFICRRWTRAIIPVQVQAARARYGEVDVEKDALINGMYADFDLVVSRVHNERATLREVADTVAQMKVKYGVNFFARNPAKDKAEALKECYGVEAPDDPEVMPAAGIRNKGCGRGKRLIGKLEKAVEKNKRAPRKCRVCDTLTYHDSRNCPMRNA